MDGEIKARAHRGWRQEEGTWRQKKKAPLTTSHLRLLPAAPPLYTIHHLSPLQHSMDKTALRRLSCCARLKHARFLLTARARRQHTSSAVAYALG